MQMRDALNADLDVIVDIYNSTIASRMVTADLEPVSVDSRVAWFKAHSPREWPLWVIEERAKVIGWLSFSRFYQRAAYDVTAELSVYIAEDYRGRGIGKMMLQRAISYAPELGFTNLIGLIFAHNLPSIRLFQTLGFKQWGHLPGVCVLDGIERDVDIFGLKVPN